MIPNTKENREQYIKRLDDWVQLYFKSLGSYGSKVPARNVDWKDPDVLGFVMTSPGSTFDVTEEEDRAWDEIEKRMDIIGQNGNDGIVYDHLYQGSWSDTVPYSVGETVIGADGEKYEIKDPSELPDNINHPKHYQSEDGIECIDAIQACLTDEEFRGYCKGNAIKYLWRERLKGGDESLQKANWYINKELGK